MALTKVSRGLLSTSIVDNGNATAITIDSSENVGIGVVPEAWHSAFTEVLQVGPASLITSGGDNARVFSNAYYDGAYKRIGTGYAHSYEQTGGTHRWFSAASGSADSSISWDESMRIDSSGNVLVGKTSTAIETVGINLFGTGRIISTADGDDVAVLNRKTSDGDIAVFKKDGSTVGSIGASGDDLVIGTGDTGIHFHDGVDSLIPWNVSTVNYRDAAIDLGTSTYRFKDLYLSGAANIKTLAAQRGDAGTLIQATSASGNGSGIINFMSSLTSTSNNANCVHYQGTTQNVNSWKLLGNGTSTWSSDINLKRDIETTRDGYLDDIKQLRVVKYKWKNDPDSETELGLIAQEVEDIFPSLVTEDKNSVGDEVLFTKEDEIPTGKTVGDVKVEGSTYKGIKYGVIPLILLKAIQEQQTLIESLTARIAALEE